MTDVDTLVHRIDQELEADVRRQKADWAEVARENRERGARLERFEAVAKHVIELLKPRLDAFIGRFQDVVKAEPAVREHTRALKLTFATTRGKAALTFEVLPDQDVNRVRLECTQEFIPAWVNYDKQAVLAVPFDAVEDDAVVRWLDERIVTFVKLYLAIVRQDADLREHLKDHLVEDPVTKIRFPKYLASSTVERDGKTYYFVDDDTRREFEKQPAAK
jgi:YHS domain-containing protein